MGFGSIRVFIASAAALLIVPAAFGSTLIARKATSVSISITPKDKQAVLTFRQNGQFRSVLAWGAINARPHPTCGKIQGPRCGPAQVELSHQRLFSSGALGKKILKGPNLCKPYDGPALPFVVAACKSPDGTYWVAQSWVRLHKPGTTVSKGARELRLSHFSGALPVLDIKLAWVKSHGVYYDHLFGSYTYLGQPVYGLRWSKTGVPLDGYGRVVYVDSLNSHWGKGWRRAQGFLSKPWSGQFCYSFWGKAVGSPNWKGEGDAYRATVMGAGVLPDMKWGPVSPLDTFDPVWQQEAYKEQVALSRNSKFCRPQKLR
jgi:hypothetical protein